MKILIVSQYFYPEQFRINDVCRELVKRGHLVTVLTGLPNYPEGKIYPGYEDKGDCVENINGITVVRCNLRPRRKGTKNLFLNYISFIRQANKQIKHLDKDFEIVYVYGISPITQAYPAIKYRKKVNKKAKVIYYCCDLWPESVRGTQNGHKEMSTRNPIFMIASLLSKHIYKNVDLICSKCLSFKTYLENKYNIDSKKISVLYEHAESNYLSVSPFPKNNGVIDFYFFGNIGAIQRCDLIVDATSVLKETNDFKIHFVGDGSSLGVLKKKVSSMNLDDKIVFHDRCNQIDVLNYYEEADFCLLTLSAKTLTGQTIPGKLTSYLASSRTIIGSIDGEAKRIIDESNSGYCCPADDERAFSKLMQMAIDNPEEMIRKGANGRIYFLNHFTLEKHIDFLESVFNKELLGAKL